MVDRGLDGERREENAKDRGGEKDGLRGRQRRVSRKDSS